MPCTTALRSMCSKGGSIRSSTWRSSSPEAPLDDEFSALAGVGGGLANDARQPLHMALEGHHARAHQAILQFGDGPRLLLQQVLRFLNQAFQQLLNAGHVAGGLRESPRELLDGRVPVQLQRIKFGAMPGFLLVTVKDLLFGFDFQLALLFLEARDGARQLAEVEFDRTHLLFEAGAGNAHLAGHVHLPDERRGRFCLAGRKPHLEQCRPGC